MPSLEVGHLTLWTRKQDLAGRLSQEEGRGEDTEEVQLGERKMSSLTDTTPAMGVHRPSEEGYQSAPAAIKNTTGNVA